MFVEATYPLNKSVSEAETSKKLSAALAQLRGVVESFRKNVILNTSKRQPTAQAKKKQKKAEKKTNDTTQSEEKGSKGESPPLATEEEGGGDKDIAEILVERVADLARDKAGVVLDHAEADELSKTAVRYTNGILKECEQLVAAVPSQPMEVTARDAAHVAHLLLKGPTHDQVVKEVKAKEPEELPKEPKTPPAKKPKAAPKKKAAPAPKSTAVAPVAITLVPVPPEGETFEDTLFDL
jgi:hypothetical protein